MPAISIASINTDLESAKSVEIKMPGIIEMLKDDNKNLPAVITFPEVGSFKAAKKITEALSSVSKDWDYYTDFLTNSKNDRMAVCTNKNTVKVSESNGFSTNRYGKFISVQLELLGTSTPQAFTHVSVHLPNKNNKGKNKVWDVLVEKCTDLSNTGPVIISGDFNASPRKLSERLKFSGASPCFLGEGVSDPTTFGNRYIDNIVATFDSMASKAPKMVRVCNQLERSESFSHHPIIATIDF
jgi:predicted class III extradiol MEMO1 family dioxygenase